MKAERWEAEKCWTGKKESIYRPAEKLSPYDFDTAYFVLLRSISNRPVVYNNVPTV
jgi:hypothetical protein